MNVQLLIQIVNDDYDLIIIFCVVCIVHEDQFVREVHSGKLTFRISK